MAETTGAFAAAQGLMGLVSAEATPRELTPDNPDFWSDVVSDERKWAALPLHSMTSKMLDFLQEDKEVPTDIVNEIILKKKNISAETRAYINNFRDKGFAEALRRMDAYNPTMRRGAARRSAVPPRAQDQSQGASSAAAQRAPQDAPEDDEDWKAQIQESVRKAAAQAISQIQSSSSSAEIVSRIASLETRFQEVKSKRVATAQEFEEKKTDIKDALDEIRAVKIEITRLELEKNKTEIKLVALGKAKKALKEKATSLESEEETIEEELRDLKTQLDKIKDQEERKAQYAQQVMQSVSAGAARAPSVSSTTAQELLELKQANLKLMEEMKKLLSRSKKKSTSSSDDSDSSSSSSSDDDDDDDDDDDYTYPSDSERERQARGKNPKLSVTPLFTKFEGGDAWYGPKPDARQHTWHTFMTKDDWKKVHFISPYCRACNGNTSQGHANTKRCKKARKLIEKIKKIGRAKQKQKKSEHSLKRQLADLEKDKKGTKRKRKRVKRFPAGSK